MHSGHSKKGDFNSRCLDNGSSNNRGSKNGGCSGIGVGGDGGMKTGRDSNNGGQSDNDEVVPILSSNPKLEIKINEVLTLLLAVRTIAEYD